MIFLGLNNACSIHEWNMNFRGENVHFMMTSVCGHVMSLDFVGKFNNWDRVDPVIKSICNKSIYLYINSFIIYRLNFFTVPRKRRKRLQSLKCQLFWPRRRKVVITWYFGWIVTKKERTSALKSWMQSERACVLLTTWVSDKNLSILKLCNHWNFRTCSELTFLPSRTKILKQLWTILANPTKMRPRV